MVLDKSKFDNSSYKPGPFWKRTLWYYTSALLFRNPFLPFIKFKVFLLKLFGAKIGERCYIKPGVNVKYPWFLEIGDYVGIGEDVWIDNLAQVTLGDNVTVSQGALLLTGNHNFKSKSFELMLGEITVCEGAWVGAKAMVGPGVTINKNAILCFGSRATKDLDADGIYDGMPAVRVRERGFTDE